MTATAAAEAAIVDAVTRGASAWLPGTPPDATVRLRTLATGRRSRVYAVSLGPDHGPPQLVAKVRRPGDPERPVAGSGRPSLTPVAADEAELTEHEFAGLAMGAEVVAAAAAAGDQRFTAVRPLALLRDHHALVMDHVTGQSVRRLVHAASRLNPARPLQGHPAPESVLPAVGAWLRLFHDSRPTASYPVRQATGREVEAHFGALEDFLGRRLGPGFGRLAGVGSGLAGQLLPPGPLPVVVTHGDFAPRNVMVDRDRRLVVLDPQPRWAAPAHEDLCRFLVGLQLLGLQTHTRGLALSPATLTRWQDLVIAGYHRGAPVAEGPLRCYQLLVLLDKWSALVDQPAPSGVRGRARRRLLDLGTGYVRAQAEQLAARARAAGD